MNDVGRYVRWAILAWLFSAVAGVRATEVVLKDGRVLTGKLGKVAGLSEMPLDVRPDSDGAPETIVLLDDSLRRTFFSQRLVREVRQEENRSVEEKFSFHQRVLHSGSYIKSVGPAVKIQPFDEFGRRTYTMYTAHGPVNVIQGITVLTPQWCKVEGVSHVWDMRLATSSIPPDELHKILLKQIDPKNSEDYKRLARFYLQSEHYGDAQETLEAMLAAFPERPELKEQLGPSIRSIAQLSAQQLLTELRLRRDAGQHKLVSEKLKRFPAEGVSGEILQGVRQMREEYDVREARLRNVVEQLRALSERIKDAELRKRVQPILAEIAEEASLETLDRMAAFLQNADDQQMPDAEKVALALSGWLLGVKAATQRLDTAVSAYQVRGLVRRYLTESGKREREVIYKAIRTEYASDPATVVAILDQMKPPLDRPEPVDGKPGYYRLEAPGLANSPAVTYHVQLPPEYDPYRHYPAIVTLNGAWSTAEQQIDWWAGPWNGGQRVGQASRRGYIVIAPVWTAERQNQYGYSARELAAVLNPLRDACRRFSIDTDRVFLSGHSMGGDAAWDIGLAHPDLWAGVIPIVAKSERYCNFYWENARYVPFYVVAGELDGARLVSNAKDLDRYLIRGFDTTVVEFLGRGHDDFHDEILRVFDWMSRFHRNFFPREFACKTMRTWDNAFWWVEMQGMPPKSTVDPVDWPLSPGQRPMAVEGTITNKNGLTVRCGASQVTVWLSPEMLDFKQRAPILVNGRRLGNTDQFVHADLQTLLEDVRTRGDRQHPFWAKLESVTGRGRAE